MQSLSKSQNWYILTKYYTHKSILRFKMRLYIYIHITFKILLHHIILKLFYLVYYFKCIYLKKHTRVAPTLDIPALPEFPGVSRVLITALWHPQVIYNFPEIEQEREAPFPGY